MLKIDNLLLSNRDTLIRIGYSLENQNLYMVEKKKLAFMPKKIEVKKDAIFGFDEQGVFKMDQHSFDKTHQVDLTTIELFQFHEDYLLVLAEKNLIIFDLDLRELIRLNLNWDENGLGILSFSEGVFIMEHFHSPTHKPHEVLKVNFKGLPDSINSTKIYSFPLAVFFHTNGHLELQTISRDQKECWLFYNSESNEMIKQAIDKLFIDDDTGAFKTRGQNIFVKRKTIERQRIKNYDFEDQVNFSSYDHINTPDEFYLMKITPNTPHWGILVYKKKYLYLAKIDLEEEFRYSNFMLLTKSSDDLNNCIDFQESIFGDINIQLIGNYLMILYPDIKPNILLKL